MSPRTGAIKLNFPDLEVWDMGESCALDVADRGGTTLEDVGAIMNLTRERIRQVEVKALAKLEALRDMMALRDYVDEGPVGKRRLPQLSKADLASMDEEDDDDESDADCEDGSTESSTGSSVDLELALTAAGRGAAGAAPHHPRRAAIVRRKLPARIFRIRSSEHPRSSMIWTSRGSSRQVGMSRGVTIAPSQSLPSEAWSSPTTRTMCSRWSAIRGRVPPEGPALEEARVVHDADRAAGVGDGAELIVVEVAPVRRGRRRRRCASR